MAVVINLDGVSQEQLSVQPRYLSEMMALLHVIAEPDHHRDRDQLLRQIRQLVQPELKHDLERFSPLWARFRFRGLLPLSHRRAQGAAAEFEQLQAVPDEAFAAMAADAIAGRRLPVGCEPEEFLSLCRQRSFQSLALAQKFQEDPLRFRQELLAFLGRFSEQVFIHTWRSVLPHIEQYSRFQEELLAQRNLHALFATLAEGSFYLEHDQKLIFDKLQQAEVRVGKRSIVLVPSVWAAPHVTVKHDESSAGFELPIVISYPVGEGNTGLNLSLLQRRLHVLGERSRLQLIRHLVNESLTTGDLAKKTNMTEPQVSRHLSKLREVGLIDSQREGYFVKHRLRTDLVYRLGVEYLKVLTR